MEGPETLTFALADNSNYTVCTEISLTVSLNDDPPVVEIGPAEMDPANLIATDGGMPAAPDVVQRRATGQDRVHSRRRSA